MAIHSFRAKLTRTATILACASLLTSSAALANEAVLVLLDRTGSMSLTSVPGKTRLQVAKERINTFLTAVPSQPTRYAFWTFEGTSYTQVYSFSQNPTRDQIKTAVNAVTAGGNTPLAYSICAAVDELIKTNAFTLRIYMVTDGEENTTPIGTQCHGPSSSTAYPNLQAGSWQRKVLNKACTGDANIPGPCATGPSPISLVVDVDHLFGYVSLTNLTLDEREHERAGAESASNFTTLDVDMDSSFFRGVTTQTQGGYATITPQTTPTQATPLPGDVDRNGCVNIMDRQLVLTQYGQSVPSGAGADFNRSGVIETGDYQTVMTNYGLGCTP